MAKRSRRYRAALDRIEADTLYTPAAALTLLKEIGGASYDPTVDTVIRLGVDTRQADQRVRGAVSLPHGIGKVVKVAVVTGGEKAAQAREAGADLVGADELIEELGAGKHLDQLGAIIATPDMMRVISKLGKVLGPKGLMPSPKNGTVTPKAADAVREFAAGKVEYRTDKGGNIHAIIGRMSFAEGDLVENYNHFIATIQKARPSTVKRDYVKRITVSGTMTPGVKVAFTSAQAGE
jgi:large subunit ribosomal protein L1